MVILKVDFYLEQAEGYVKTLEKSTSRFLRWGEVFEICKRNDQAGYKSLKVILKVLSTVRSGEPAGSRT